MKSLKDYCKEQKGFTEIIDFIKANKNSFNESKLVFYDEIEILRLKYEKGNDAAKNYQQHCKDIDKEFKRIFIEKNINFRRDLDNSCVKDFMQIKKHRMKNISLLEGSQDNANRYDSMDNKTKALYM